MKSEEPAAFAEAAEMRRMLQQLGQDGEPATRDAAQENAREERMAASMDAELAGLVNAQRWRRRALYGVASAAALLALTLGARHLRFEAGSLAISAEPASGAKVTQQLETSPERATAAALPVPVSTGMPRASAAPAPVAAPSVASATEPESTLAEENQLFKDAAEAGRNGDVNGAVARLDKLLQQYPASPLAQTALVRKFRLLAKAGRTAEARHEAERYLSAFPMGFAVNEARSLQAAAVGEQGAP